MFQCSDDGRDLFLSREGNGLDWGAAICGPASDIDFVAKTRAEAQKACKARWGTPDLLVNVNQSCTCCPIKCSGAPYGDPELEGKLGADAKAICEDSRWGGNQAHLQLGHHRGCHCKCKTGATAGENLWKHKDQCEKDWGGSFQNCNECHCKNHTAGDKSLQVQRSACENTEKGKFIPNSCSCMCKNDPSKNLFEEKKKGTDRNHKFDPHTCSCVCGATTCGTSAKTLIADAKSKCESVPGHVFSDDGGVCSCKCGTAGSFYEDKNYSHPYDGDLICDAATKCRNDGGSVNNSNPCNCQCSYEGAISNVDAAKANCSGEGGDIVFTGEELKGGVFSLNDKKCSCKCHATNSEDDLQSKSISTARKFCPNPLLLRIKENKGCDCLCKDADPDVPSNVSLASEKEDQCDNLNGRFKNETCQCFQKDNITRTVKCSSCRKDDLPRKGEDWPYTDCKDKCILGISGEGGGGGHWEDPWDCFCKQKGTDAVKLGAQGQKMCFWGEKDTCEISKSGVFHADGCECLCKDPNYPAPWDDKQGECTDQNGHFDKGSCDCQCQDYAPAASDRAVWHGDARPNPRNLTSDARRACAGTFTIKERGSAPYLKTCTCEPLTTEPCCNDGSGTLISQARKQCAACGGHLEGQESECHCSADVPCPASSPAPEPTAPEEASSESTISSDSPLQDSGSSSSSSTEGTSAGSSAGSSADPLLVKSCRHRKCDASINCGSNQKSPDGNFCADATNSPGAAIDSCTSWTAGGGGFFRSAKACDKDVSYPDKLEVQAEFEGARGVYTVTGYHNNRPKYQSSGGATLKFETKQAGEWGATSWLGDDGWVLLQDVKYRYGIKTIADIGELTTITEWSTMNSATNPIKILDSVQTNSQPAPTPTPEPVCTKTHPFANQADFEAAGWKAMCKLRDEDQECNLESTVQYNQKYNGHPFVRMDTNAAYYEHTFSATGTAKLACGGQAFGVAIKRTPESTTWEPLLGGDMHLYQQVGMIGRVQFTYIPGTKIKLFTLSNEYMTELGWNCPKSGVRCDGQCQWDANRQHCYNWDGGRIFLYELEKCEVPLSSAATGGEAAAGEEVKAEAAQQAASAALSASATDLEMDIDAILEES